MTRNSLLHWMLIGGRGKQLRRAEAAFPLTLIRAADVRVWKIKIRRKMEVKKSNVFDATYRSFHAMSEGNRWSVRKLKWRLNSRVCRSKPPKGSNSVSNVVFLTTYFLSVWIYWWNVLIPAHFHPIWPLLDIAALIRVAASWFVSICRHIKLPRQVPTTSLPTYPAASLSRTTL